MADYHTSQEPSVKDNSRRPQRSASPVIAVLLIGLGLIFLLNNFGLVAWDVWGGIWRFWPLVLILFGLQALFGRGRFGSFLVFLLTLIIIGALAIWSLLGSGPLQFWAGETKHDTLTIGDDEYLDITKLSLNVHEGIGTVFIQDDVSSRLFNLDASYVGGGKPSVDKKQTADTLLIDVNRSSAGGFFWRGGDFNSDITLGNPFLKTSVNLKTGVGTARMDLDEVSLERLKIESGTGTVSVSLGRSSIPSGETTIDLGTGTVKLEVPKEVGVEVRYNLGLGAVSVDGERLKGEGSYTTPGFSDAAKKLVISVKVGTGTLRIDRL